LSNKVLSYSKVALSFFFGRARPQPPHEMRDVVEIHVYESFSVHHLSFVRFFLRVTRTLRREEQDV
jgi:hypothetical protein